MFSQISWSSYLTTILLLSAAYYLFLAFYYRKDVVKIFFGKKNTSDENISMSFQKPMLQSS